MDSGRAMRLRARKNRRKPSIQNAAKRKSSKPKTPLDYMKAIESHVEEFEVDAALSLCNEAVQHFSSDYDLLENVGAVYLEFGRPDLAIPCLRKAVELKPDLGHSKYMYLGQLTGGMEAVTFYEKGIELMNAQLMKKTKGPSGVTRTDLSNAYCALAEIYMTDACEEDEAEKKCEAYCRSACEADPENPEAMMVSANYLLTVQKVDEAKTLINKNLQTWLTDDVNSESLPCFQSRLTLAKMLVELQDLDIADRILQVLVNEDEDSIDAWHLAGYVSYLRGDWVNAVDCLEKTLQLITRDEPDDVEVQQHCESLLVSCRENALQQSQDDTDCTVDAQPGDSCSDNDDMDAIEGTD